MAEAREEFNKWRAEVELLLERLAESAQGELGAELRELRTTLETADYRDLPRARARPEAACNIDYVLDAARRTRTHNAYVRVVRRRSAMFHFQVRSLIVIVTEQVR
jgi:hypothetical protein